MLYQWKPPKSPVGMLQEDLWPDEWKILVACLLHNQTSRKQVDKVYQELFTRYPDATSMMNSDVHELQDLIKPLGMWKRRTETLQRFSREYLTKKWSTPKDLYGCGKYADDVWRVFIRGDWKLVVPNDRALNKYHDFLKQRSKNA
tara:strand:+ start:92 stop:526 length:435 start_codon:yes stop_codon:yes gene_type:complete